MLEQTIALTNQLAWRLINSKFPPIDIFDDVADASEFTALFAIQQLTNPRLQNEVGNLALLPPAQIPFGITGCSYACAPFTHVNPDGSRFSDGSFGVLYLADEPETAVSEVLYHQQKYWQNVPDLAFDSIVMRGLKFSFSAELVDLSQDVTITHPDDYGAARITGARLLNEASEGIQYLSVRKPGATCWALMTPKNVHYAMQSSHYEFIYDGSQISSVRLIAATGTTEVPFLPNDHV
ncbi:MAG: hypothetical protein ACI8WB_002497 [Phenylobacterium sp.]|jgi:hypothetical protein